MPNLHRAAGQALGRFTHWIFAALAPGTIFLFFCVMMVLHLVWARVMVPETKGVPLEQTENKLGLA